MRCYACGYENELASGERVGFRDDCDGCGGALHVCRNCRHYDDAAYNECRESSADRVLDKERANRCDYFAAGAGGGADRASDRDRAELERLFRK